MCLLMFSDPSYALRCGHRIVKEGMHEVEVRRICGEPVSVRHFGFVLRSYHHTRQPYTGGVEMYFGGNRFHQELAVTELLYNFGPRKLMRRMRFEGDRLTLIETAGYGYLKKDE